MRIGMCIIWGLASAVAGKVRGVGGSGDSIDEYNAEKVETTETLEIPLKSSRENNYLI